jgi:hypothetical protein
MIRPAPKPTFPMRDDFKLPGPAAHGTRAAEAIDANVPPRISLICDVGQLCRPTVPKAVNDNNHTKATGMAAAAAARPAPVRETAGRSPRALVRQYIDAVHPSR